MLTDPSDGTGHGARATMPRRIAPRHLLYAAALVVAGLYGLALARNPAVVVTRELRVVDAQGRPRLVVSTDTAGGVQMYLMGRQKPGRTIVLTVDGDDNPSIGLYGADGKARLLLSSDGDEQSALSVCRPGGKTLVCVGHKSDVGTGLKVFDHGGTARLFAGVGGDTARLGLLDARRRLRAQIAVEPNGKVLACTDRAAPERDDQ